MYRRSQLPRKVLITTDEVIAQCAADENPGVRQLLAAIQIAEERFILPMIGRDMYYDFRNKKNVVVNSINKAFLEGLINEGNTSEAVVLNEGDIVNALELVDNTWYKELWIEHLWKLTAECVIYIASPTNYSRFTSSGEMENNPKSITNEGQGSATVDLNKMKWKMDKMLMDRINPLITAFDAWMYANRGQFPLFKNYADWNNNEVVDVKRKSPWITGIYKNDRRNCEYECGNDFTSNY